jgi:Domain of unknown function (DUF1830)
MVQILDSIPEGQDDCLLCSYINVTSQIQIARITNIPNWYFERVVFPGQRLVFEALPEALLEIHTGMMASAILSDTIPCHRLRVKEDGDVEEESIEQKSALDRDDRSHRENTAKKNSYSTSSQKTAVIV